MRRVRSPTPNRHGRHGIHEVPDRKVAMLQAQGWELVDESSSGESSEASSDADVPDETANLYATHRGGGYYRVTCGDEVVAESVTKAEAREMGADV